LPALEPDSLTLFAFGPGYGELVIVRAPPNEWLVIDGCAVGKRGYATSVLDHYQAQPRIIVLTHPHDDHCRGLVDLLDLATPRGREDQWPRIGLVAPVGPSQSRGGGFVARETWRVIEAVESRWRSLPRCRWEMYSGDSEPLGEATIRVLSPEASARKDQLARWNRGERFDKNILSTAFLIEWRGRRLVLGSDLVDGARGWSYCLGVDATLPDHDVLKVPHHGSDEALHEALFRAQARVDMPLRVVTPFLKGDVVLPRFSQGEGIARIHTEAGTVYVTGLPRAPEMQSGKAEAWRLEDLTEHRRMAFTPTTSGFPDCFVTVTFPPGDGPPRVEQGPGSVLVLR